VSGSVPKEPIADPDQLSRAQSAVREWNSVGANYYRRGFAAWSTAIFGPLLALFGPLVCIPATAHALGQPHVQPIGLLGTLFFGTFGYLAIRKVKEHRWAVRYLAEHGQG
jgi:hypothetical protein